MSLPATESISIIIVSYNTRDYLRRCLATLQQWPASIPQQVIVIDNLSSDGSPEAVERDYPNVLLLRSPANDGYGVAINTAVRSATGTWLMFLNPDVEVMEGALDEMLRFCNAHPRAGVIGPRLLYGNGQPQASAKHFLSAGLVLAESVRLHKILPERLRSRLFLGTYFAQNRTLKVGWLCGACHLIPRTVWNAIGPLTEETFCGSDDYDYCYRATRGGYEVWLCASASMTHHSSIAVRQRWTRWEVEQVAIHNFYVVMQGHWPQWRVRLFSAAEIISYVLEIARHTLRPRFPGELALGYRERLGQRLRLTTGLFTGREIPQRRFQATKPQTPPGLLPVGPA